MEICNTCGRKLHWIEVAFGRSYNTICGKCLKANGWQTTCERCGKEGNTVRDFRRNQEDTGWQCQELCPNLRSDLHY